MNSELGAWCKTRSLIESRVGPHQRLQVIAVTRMRLRAEPAGDWPVPGSDTRPVFCQRVNAGAASRHHLDSGGAPTVIWGSRAARGAKRRLITESFLNALILMCDRCASVRRRHL